MGTMDFAGSPRGGTYVSLDTCEQLHRERGWLGANALNEGLQRSRRRTESNRSNILLQRSYDAVAYGWSFGYGRTSDDDAREMDAAADNLRATAPECRATQFLVTATTTQQYRRVHRMGSWRAPKICQPRFTLARLACLVGRPSVSVPRDPRCCRRVRSRWSQLLAEPRAKALLLSWGMKGGSDGARRQDRLSSTPKRCYAATPKRRRQGRPDSGRAELAGATDDLEEAIWIEWGESMNNR